MRTWKGSARRSTRTGSGGRVWRRGGIFGCCCWAISKGWTRNGRSILQRLADAKLVLGRTLGIDATTLEANGAMRSIVRRDTGESYDAFLTRLAEASGLATPTRAELGRDEIKRAVLIYEMLDGRKTGRRTRRGRFTVRPLKQGPRDAMIDWNAVLATLPAEFTLDTLSAHETASGKTRAYLRQVVVRWSQEGRIRRRARGMYEKAEAPERTATA